MVGSQGKMMRLKPVDIDHIIKKIEKITVALTKTDFLTRQEQKQLQRYTSYENWRKLEMDLSKIDVRPFNGEEDKHRRNKIKYNADTSQALKDKLSKAQTEHIGTTLQPLQKELDGYLIPERWNEIRQLSRQGNQLKQDIEVFIWIFAFTHGDGRTCYYDRRCVTRFPPTQFLKSIVFNNTITALKEKVIHELKQVKASLEYKQTPEPVETGQETKPIKEPKTKKRGRPRVYTDDQLKRMLDSYDEFYEETKDSKAAWNKVAKHHGAKNGDAARVACMNYRKRLKKSK